MQRKAIDGRFRGKVAVVTGGSNGIGRATVFEFCREGGSAIFVDRELESGRAFEAELKALDLQASFVHGDMTDEAVPARVVEKAVLLYGRIDYLVNNAFSFVSRGADATMEDWNQSYHAGPIAYARMGAASAEIMRRTGGGAIVNISSISAFVAQPKRWTYNSAKGAVHTLTKCMALDLAEFGIRVNSVSPGWTWTREVLKAATGGREKWDPVWGQFGMLGRCGDPVEVAGPILFLLSDDASFITGADLPVDGGYQALGSEGTGKLSQFVGTK